MKPRHLILFLLGATLLGLLTACGGAAGNAPAAPATATPIAVTTVTAPAMPTNSALPMAPASVASATPANSPTPASIPLPTGSPTPAGPAGATRYIVAPGDTLSAIAARYGLATDRLARANGIVDPNRLLAGQVLLIPSAAGDLATATPAAATETPAPATETPAPPSATPQPTLPPAGTVIQYRIQPGDTVSALARRYNTTVDAIAAHSRLDNPGLILTGDVLTIVVGDQTSRPAPTPVPATPLPSPTPAAPGTDGLKWIDVNLSTETVTAYEGDTAIYSWLASIGVPAHPTVVGTFHIYAKLMADDMRGGVGAEAYYLPNVPYVMYFYQGGYALHGTYWHHNWGHPMSHGCVNLPTPAAQWLFDWAPLGTTVQVHW